MDTDWMREGKCRDMDPDVFFPSDGVGVQVAQRVCNDCPAKAPCLEYALALRINEGVWGGTSERERRRLQRHRRGVTTTSFPVRDPQPAGRHWTAFPRSPEGSGGTVPYLRPHPRPHPR